MKETHSTPNVFDAALLRLDIIINKHEEVCISLSGGKASTVLLHLAATVAKAHGKNLTVLFIDREAQHTQTISHIQHLKQLYRNVIDHFYWIALPLTIENSTVSNGQTWIAWEDNVEWWRRPPAEAITDKNAFPFYHYAMTDSQFTSAFLNWRASGKTLAFAMGTLLYEVNNDDSLLTQEHYSAANKESHMESEAGDQIHTQYPLFDWQSQDIWLFNSLSKASYNPLYDLMCRSGTPRNNMKIQEPFEQRATDSFLYKAHPSRRDIPSTPHKEREHFSEETIKPCEHTWHSYAAYLLNSMPRKMADQFRANIAQYLSWHRSRGFLNCIPDENACATEEHDIVSWEKICTMILSNDYRSLTLSVLPPQQSDTTLCFNTRRKSRRGRSRSNDIVFL